MANELTICSTPLHVGDLVRLHLKVVEGDKERSQIFEGMIIGARGRGDNQTFTIRKIAAGNIGVERIFPTNTPWITKAELKKAGKVRRAKLYYVRDKSAKQVAQITQAS